MATRPSVLAPPNRKPLVLTITLLTLAVLAVSIICLFLGDSSIFENLYYIPIILACMYYARRGLAFSAVLAMAYLGLMLAFSRNSIDLRDAAIRAAFFILIAWVITYLSLVRKRSEDAVAASEQRYRLLFENMTSGFALHELIYDQQGSPVDCRYLAVNPAFEQLTGLPSHAMVGHTLLEVLPATEPQWIETYAEVVRSGKPAGFERYAGALGKWLVVRVFKTSENQFATMLGDVTDRKRVEQKLEEIAKHDFLTGLPNRALLIDRFNIASALAHRNKAKLAVMSLDLDRFKSINDNFGHDIGDQVLKVVARHLTGIMRASDTIARVGGDEFVSVMMETGHMEDSTAAAQKILDLFVKPLSVEGHQLLLSTSIGIATYPDDGEDLETLTRKSDVAMYFSKNHGRNQFAFYKDDSTG